MDIDRFEKLPLMGILRGVKPDDVEPLLDVVIRAGLGTIEITMNTSGARVIIKKAVTVARGRISIGAGTVLSMDDLDAALSAGASFIVMPICDKKLVGTCGSRSIPVFPGALTPGEVFAAWDAGATMVKVFPASVFPPKYIKELKGPFNDVKLMAVGGVRLDNIREFFLNGADAVAFGGSVFKKEWLKNGDWDAIGSLVAGYVKEVREHCRQKTEVGGQMSEDLGPGVRDKVEG